MDYQRSEGTRDMSTYSSEEKVKQQVIDKMGIELGSLYYVLWIELLWVNTKWGEYVELFGTKPSRIELMNRAAGLFFRIVQDTLWEDTFLHITRLTDQPEYRGKERLTILKLPDLISDQEFKGRLSKLIDVAVEKAEFCRDWRNRRIAHRDFKLAMEKGAKPLKSANCVKVKDVLSSISDVLNTISSYYVGEITEFSDRGELRGAYSLLYIIDNGLKGENERIERLNAGIPRDDDLQSPNL
jgi:hypothetical protein